MNDLQMIFNKAEEISKDIGKLVQSSTYADYDDLSGLDIDYKEPEQLFLLDELRYIIGKLDDAKNHIDYLLRPITKVGTLRRTANGRYEALGMELNCGAAVEVLIDDGYRDVPHWWIGRIEGDSDGYHLYGNSQIPLEGLKIRFRA